MESPCISINTLQTPVLEFWYHVYGGIGGSLTVDVNQGGNWTTGVFTLNGAQQISQSSPWLKATVSLSAFAGKTIRLRFRGTIPNSTTMGIAIDDIRIFDFSATLNDVGVSSITKPTGSSCDKTTTEQVCVNLKNFGNTTRKNFIVSYKINNLSAIIEVFADSLLPGQTKPFCFNTRANFSAAGTYKLNTYTQLTGDQDRVNDTTKLTFTNKVSAANFTFNNTTGSTFQFTTQGINTGAFIKWYFGDGDSTTTMMPLHTYALPGTYTVTMKATDYQGCTSTVQKVVTVLGGTILNDVGVVQVVKPTAGSNCNLSTNQEVCVNITNFGNVKQKHFNVSYRVNNLPVITELFSDSLLPNQTKQFCFATKSNLSQAGLFNLKIYSNLTNDLSRVNDTLKVTVQNKVSNLNFIFTQALGTSVQFTGQNLASGAPVKWHFGDGDSAMVANPTHQYLTAGNYTVTLTGTDTQGCTFTIQKAITVGITGISKNFDSDFSIYPNPASEVFAISVKDKKAYNFELISVLGQRILTGKVSARTPEFKIPVKDLPAGTYFLRVSNSDQIFTKQIVVSR